MGPLYFTLPHTISIRQPFKLHDPRFSPGMIAISWQILDLNPNVPLRVTPTHRSPLKPPIQLRLFRR